MAPGPSKVETRICSIARFRFQFTLARSAEAGFFSSVAKARRNLRALKANSVRIKHGDGSADLGEDLEVDGIMVTAAATQVPAALLRYLKVGGRMVLPLARHDEELKGVQLLTVIEKATGGIREQTYDAVRFVPLLSGLA